MSVSLGVRALLYCLAIAITASCGTRIIAPDTSESLASGDDNRKLSRKHKSALTLPDKRQFTFKGPFLNRQPRIAELRRIGVLAPNEQVATEFHELPLFFANRSGKDKREFNFIARGLRFTMFLAPNEIVSVVGKTDPVKGHGASSGDAGFTGDAIHLKFLKAAAVKPRGEVLTEAKFNRILGANSNQWSLGEPLYGAVSYRGLYPDIDLFVHGSNGRPAFAFQIGPDAQAEDIQLQYTGAKSLGLDAEGNLIIGTSRGPIVNTTPRFFEVIDGKPSPLKGELLLADNHTFSYHVEGRTPGSTVVIDPEIIFASYFGGSLQEGGSGLELRARDFIGRGFDIDVGERGNLFVAGETVSSDFDLTVEGAFGGAGDVYSDVFALHLTAPPAQVMYISLFGGSATDRVNGITAAGASSRYAYLCGHTSSPDFPIAARRRPSGFTFPFVIMEPSIGPGGYVLRLDTDGSIGIGAKIGTTPRFHPTSCTFENSEAHPNGDFGALHVVGAATHIEGADGSQMSAGALQSEHAGALYDGFYAKFGVDPDGFDIDYLTFFGGSGNESIMDVDVFEGTAYVTGATSSIDFPTTPYAKDEKHSLAALESAADTECHEFTPGLTPSTCFDVFVARINPGGEGEDDVVFSTFLGNNDDDVVDSEYAGEEYARGIAVVQNNGDRQGFAYITGATLEADPGGQARVLLASVSALGGSFGFTQTSPAINGLISDHGEDVAVDSLGRAHLVGSLGADGASVGLNSHEYQGGSSDMFYARVNPDGQVEYSTYLGGGAEDLGYAIATWGQCVHLAGSTLSTDVDTVAALQENLAGDGNFADLLLYTLCDLEGEIPNGNFTKECDSPVRAGRTASCTLTVRNDSDYPIPVRIVDNLPAALDLSGGVTASDLGCNPHDDDNSIICEPPGGAPPGVSAVFFDFLASSDPGDCGKTVSNTAILQVANNPDWTVEATANVYIECECNGICCDDTCCGDGVVNGTEECDWNDSATAENCSFECKPQPFCGDDVVNSSEEECDEPGVRDPEVESSCNNECKLVAGVGRYCGDDLLECNADAGLACVRDCTLVEEPLCGIATPFFLLGCILSGPGAEGICAYRCMPRADGAP